MLALRRHFPVVSGTVFWRRRGVGGALPTAAVLGPDYSTSPEDARGETRRASQQSTNVFTANDFPESPVLSRPLSCHSVFPSHSGQEGVWEPPVGQGGGSERGGRGEVFSVTLESSKFFRPPRCVRVSLLPTGVSGLVRSGGAAYRQSCTFTGDHLLSGQSNNPQSSGKT